jgi:SCY1-like protein 1
LGLLVSRVHFTFLQEVFSGEPLRAVEQLRRTDVIPPALLADYQKLLSSQVGRRLNPAKVGGSVFFFKGCRG